METEMEEVEYLEDEFESKEEQPIVIKCIHCNFETHSGYKLKSHIELYHSDVNKEGQVLFQ